MPDLVRGPELLQVTTQEAGRAPFPLRVNLTGQGLSDRYAGVNGALRRVPGVGCIRISSFTAPVSFTRHPGRDAWHPEPGSLATLAREGPDSLGQGLGFRDDGWVGLAATTKR